MARGKKIVRHFVGAVAANMGTRPNQRLLPRARSHEDAPEANVDADPTFVLPPGVLTSQDSTAKLTAEPNRSLSSSPSQASAAMVAQSSTSMPRRKGRANLVEEPLGRLPAPDVLSPGSATIPAEPNRALSIREAEERAKAAAEPSARLPAPGLSFLLERLKQHHRQRQDFYQAAQKINQQIKAIQRRIHAGDCPKDTHKTCAGVSKQWSPTCEIIKEAGEPLKEQQEVHEKAMMKLAEELPVFEWWNAIRGVGSLGLAQIAAEAGDLAKYSRPGKLWMRMGQAPGPEGQTRYEGRSPRRASVIYNIGVALMRGNRGGYYKALYDARKEYEATKPPCGQVFKGGKGSCKDATGTRCRQLHIHNRAQRYMVKRLLRELWSEWRRATKTLMEPTGRLSRDVSE